MSLTLSTENPTGSLAGLFSEMAGSAPGQVALIADGRETTYRQLDEWSDRIGFLLREHEVGAGDRVAIRMPPDATAVAAILGILKAGAAYVPIDIGTPASRSAFVIDDSDATVLMGNPPRTASKCRTISVAEIERVRYESVCAVAHDGPRSQDTAYVIYTSGTTGNPKGVSVSHGNVLSLLDAASGLFDFSAEDRWLLFHSLAFDFSVWEMWGAFSTGGTLVVLPYWAARTPRQYLSVIAEHRVTVLNQTPSAFSGLTNSMAHTSPDISSLRYIVFGGEKVTPAILRPWSKLFGIEHPRLVNGYGVTEATVFATFHVISEQDLNADTSVIGTALPGFTTRIVGSDGSDVPPGREGELWLAGPQVANGYVNQPDLTRERFPEMGKDSAPVRYYRSGDLVSQLPGKELCYRGRADSQVKLRGYRIELGDIETAVRTQDNVLDAMVWVREFKPGDSRLVCAFLPINGTEVDVRKIRENINSRLPIYMRPSHYRPFPAFPQTTNGKTDRAAVARLWEERG